MKGITSTWRRILALALAGILALTAALSGTMAWADFSQHRTNAAEGSGPPPLSSALLQKYETGTTTPVPGTEFGLYRMEADGTATLVRYFITGADGQILASELPPGEYYWQETRPAPGYLPELEGGQPKKYPFTVPGEDGEPVRVEAYNTRSSGHLIVTKTVTGEGGDLNREFEFTAVIGGVTHTFTLRHGKQKIFENVPAGTEYVVTETPVAGYATTSENHSGVIPAGGTTATFTNAYSAPGSLTITKTVTGEDADLDLEFDFVAVINGVEHEFKLKHGQPPKVFENLLPGTEYTVTETPKDGYTAGHLSYSGKITLAGQNVTLPFVNHHGEPTDPSGRLEITKTVAGTNPDLDKEFTFTIVFEGENAPTSPQTFTLKHGDKETIAPIPHGVKYTVTEAPEAGYAPDFTTATGTIMGGQTASVGFINRTPVLPRDFRITVVKRVLGTPPDADLDKLFRFTLTINGTPHNFSLKAGETSTPYTVRTGDVYALAEQDSAGYTRGMVGNGFGVVGNEDIIIVQTNIYDGPEYIDIEGEKTWQAPAGTTLPESVTILLKRSGVTERTTTTNSSKNWRYKFEQLPKHDALGNVIQYTVEEVRIPGWRPVLTGYDIKNHHQTPLEDTAIEVEKTVTGVPNVDAVFKFILTAVNGAPMPESNEIVVAGAGKASFGQIAYTEPGIFTYTITEIDEKLAGWSYDASVYTLTVTVTEDADGKLTASKALTKAGQPAEKALFTNRYDASGETISVRVTKVWQGDGPHPQSVQVQLYKDGTAHGSPATLSAANDWKRVWPDLEKGHVWTVQEINKPEGYTVTVSGDAVNGFTVTNTKGTPQDEKTSVKVTKIWKGEDANRPASVVVQLYKDGAAEGLPVTLSEANGWTYTFTGLAKDPKWTADEVNVPNGYIGSVTGDAANGFVITNTKLQTPEPGEDEITISGKKTWNHGENPEAKRPEFIILLVKANGAIMLQKRVSALEKWSWEFKMPKHDAGEKIEYTVDEAQVENYVKTVDGFNLINTYSPGGGPGKPGDPSKPGPSKPNTGDESNLALWLALLALSLGGLAVLIVISIVRRKKRREREAEIWASGLL